MAIVTTDDKHYKDIANVIRSRRNESADVKYKPSEMAGAVDRACQETYNKASELAFNNGYAYGLDTGRMQERSERDEQEATYLSNINNRVELHGVDRAETLSDVPKAVDDVYSKGGQETLPSSSYRYAKANTSSQLIEITCFDITSSEAEQ